MNLRISDYFQKLEKFQFKLSERNLVAAVIHRAITDLNIIAFRREAIQWFYSDSDEPYSFNWCIEQLDLGIDVRKEIYEIITDHPL